MPLVSSFKLSTKKGKEAWVEPVIDRNQQPPLIRFEAKTGEGKPPEPPKTGRGAKFYCLACSQPVDDKHIKAEGVAGRMGAQLMAIVAEGKNSRVYIAPTPQHDEVAHSAQPTWYPNAQISDDRRSMFTPLYGLTHFHHLFTPRQLVALNTFSDLVSEAREQIRCDFVAAGMPDDNLSLGEGGKEATAYADAVATYLAFGVSKISESSSTICTWSSSPKNELVVSTFRRQAIPMTWDFAEANLFGLSSGSIVNIIQFVAKAVAEFPAMMKGNVRQADAKTEMSRVNRFLISTDPPYYDNIGYADLSDFFYVWLRRSVGKIYPNLFSTLLVPKTQELVATPYRFGGDKQKAQEFFEEGLAKAFARMREAAHSNFPLTVYYAFKQSEKDDEDDKDGNNITAISSTGWETMLEGLIKADFSITGTWPVRTERSTRSVSIGTNALASSIVLVCRPRSESAPSTTRRQFLTTLKRELPEALKTLQQGNIAPVDLAQASIGPGMAVFSRYAKVLEADGTPMRVRTALQLINQTLDEFLTEQEGEFDADTRWALTWFEQHQFDEGKYGDAETLSKAKNTSVTGLVNSGILKAKGGKVQLLRRDELPDNWTPEQDDRTPDWEVTQHLIWTLDQKGESGASVLLSKLGDRGEVARDLAYRLYSICDRKSWTQEAIAYNSLVISWPEISRLAAEEHKQPTAVQGELEL
jgi:putative DNA methylase